LKIVSAKNFNLIKRAEARARMASVRAARENPRRAAAVERRHALADGSKGRLTNLFQVMQAMAGRA
jgi:hypothetical protein